MSPQSRAAANDDARSTETRWPSGNSCPAPSKSTTNVQYALHKIECESGDPTNSYTNPLERHSSHRLQRKRILETSSSSSSSPKNINQPFLSSYGSAFLSGIFADIAQASVDDDPQQSTVSKSDEPHPKKARSQASTSLGRQPKSCKALANQFDGTSGEEEKAALSPASAVVSPRPKNSALKIQLFNDQVRELQDMAFPSLPNIPAAISSGSCTTLSSAVASRNVDEGEQGDSPSYGWFVSIDGDAYSGDNSLVSSPGFLPNTRPDLAFKAVANPSTQDMEVQQALAADTVDDVLGDFF